MSPETIPVRKGEELNLKNVEAFVRRHFKDASDDPLEVKQFSAGRSNLTYQLKIGDWEAVLRRPPLGPVAPKAHDMEREYLILKEIHPYFPQAPKPYVFADESVIGSPFFIMERKRGVVLDSEFPEGVTVTGELCRKISQTMVDTLADLHRIDYRGTRLMEMTRPEGFMERQVHGWMKRYDRAKTEEIDGVDRLKNWMADCIPQSPEPAIIHYDYKLNNAMFDGDDFSRMVGLFDWEMTTVGDPLADVAVAMTYWIEPDDSDLLMKGMEKSPVTAYPGFISRDEFIQAYAVKSGRDVSGMDFYLTFAYFKLAVICQQIYYRWFKGQTQDERFTDFNLFARNLLEYALYLTEKGK